MHMNTVFMEKEAVLAKQHNSQDCYSSEVRGTHGAKLKIPNCY